MEEREYVKDEIDLRDYIKVILKRKKIILAVFFVAMITAAVVSLLMPRVYEAVSTIQIGNVDGLLIEKSEAKEMLSGRSLSASVIKELSLDLKPGVLKENIRTDDIGGTNLLRIKVQYPDADTVVKINKVIANHFISRGQVIYQERLSPINERLKELEAEIKNTEENIRITQNLIVKPLNDPTAISQLEIGLRAILLQNILPHHQGRLSALRNHRNSLKTSLIKARDFEIVEPPFKPEYPISPNKKLNLAISGILGLMLGVFIAFSQEFWQSPQRNTKEEERKD